MRPADQGDHLFLGQRGPLGARGIQIQLTALGQVAGVAATPHMLRHTFATRLPVRTAPCLQVLRQIWVQQYYLDAAGDAAVVCVREPGNLPPAARCICSPYDADARYARHNAQVWVGYRTHLTESCDPDAKLHVITQVETVLAPTQDVEVVATIHADLAEHGLTPQQHYVDIVPDRVRPIAAVLSPCERLRRCH